MVISRPGGAADVEYRMIARPLVQRLDDVCGRVELVVLRPPSLDALEGALAEAAQCGEPFQVVHFDGHGKLSKDAAWNMQPGTRREPEPEGVLMFEAPGESRVPLPVRASRLARVLARAHVPLVVLNACQSGAVGKQVEASVAVRLLQEGTASVVAMAYSVYAGAAAEFVAAFYERLFAGDTVSAAVTAGRRRLFTRNERPSMRGQLPLADWMVPVHYLRRDVSFPGLAASRAAGRSRAQDAQHWSEPAGHDSPLAPAGVLVGRDGLFYELEASARTQRTAVLHGPAGTGKTELAKAFGRWWQQTGGVERPEWVFWHSFDAPVTSSRLDAIVTEIGARALGDGFAQLGEPERIAAVEGFLHARRALLIWDNFESVHALPESPPGDGERGRLRRFLLRLATGGDSFVVITSRSREAWLDQPGPLVLRRLLVSGLLPREAAEYADTLLAPYPAAGPRRATREFGELMDWLDGNPLSMRLVLPHLATSEPGALLDAMRGAVPLPGSAEEPRAASILSASLSYGFARLDPLSRRLLSAACLFQGIVMAYLLAAFSDRPEVPERFSGLDTQAWTRALDAAAEAGLLTRLVPGAYRIHPALPGFLAAAWRDEEPASYGRERTAAQSALLDAFASYGSWLTRQISSGDARLAYAAVSLHKATMVWMLGHALDEHHWADALSIMEPLVSYCDTRCLYGEADALDQQVRLATESPDGTPPELETPQGLLWLRAAVSQASRMTTIGRLDAARQANVGMVDLLRDLPASPQQQSQLLSAFLRLGTVAWSGGQLDEAASWIAQAQEIGEQPADPHTNAVIAFQAGNVAMLRGALDEAATRYDISRAALEQLGDQPRLATVYYQLGLLAQERGQLDEATSWYVRSMDMRRQLGDESGLASSYFQLGVVAQLRHQPDDAERWYNSFLPTLERAGQLASLARYYHQLGRVAQEQDRPDQAAEWFTLAVRITTQIGDRPVTARNYHQLGVVSLEQGLLDDAAGWCDKALAVERELDDKDSIAITAALAAEIAERQGNLSWALEMALASLLFRFRASGSLVPEPAEPGPAQANIFRVARLTRRLGMQAVETCLQHSTNQALPAGLRDFLLAVQNMLTDNEDEHED
jgi:tetratricopeptide (TPR) repeat protein